MKKCKILTDICLSHAGGGGGYLRASISNHNPVPSHFVKEAKPQNLLVNRLHSSPPPPSPLFLLPFFCAFLLYLQHNSLLACIWNVGTGVLVDLSERAYHRSELGYTQYARTLTREVNYIRWSGDKLLFNLSNKEIIVIAFQHWIMLQRNLYHWRREKIWRRILTEPDMKLD